MRQVLAIISRRVPPAAVSIEEAGFLAVKWKMAISLVESSRTAFFLEEINYVGQSIALEKELLNAERERTHRSTARCALNEVFALRAEGIEVERPEVPIPPLLHLPCVMHPDATHSLPPLFLLYLYS